MKKYTGKIDKCPYCKSDKVRFCGMMTDHVLHEPRLYQVLAVWSCKKCGEAFREIVEW